jgi:RND family efflux transporter MFP subunit
MYPLAINFKRLVTSIGLLSVVSMTHAQQYDAVLAWSQRIPLSTLSSGVVTDIYVNAGDLVKQNDLLLQLDPVIFEQRIKQTAVALKSADEFYLEAKRERDRSQELYNRTVLSDHELQVAKNNVVYAKAHFEGARLQHEKAKYDYKYSRIIAPFNALILERNVQPGQVVSSEFQPLTLLIVADSDRMRARIWVKQDVLHKIQMKQSAKVYVDDKTFDGRIVAIGFEPAAGGVNPGAYPVDIEFNTAQQVLRAGLRVKVEIQ